MGPKGPQELGSLLSKRCSGPFGKCLLQFLARFRELPDPEEQQPEVEADALGVREDAHERPEPAERLRRIVLVEEADRGSRARLGIVRGPAGGRRKLALGGDGMAEALESDAV